MECPRQTWLRGSDSMVSASVSDYLAKKLYEATLFKLFDTNLLGWLRLSSPKIRNRPLLKVSGLLIWLISLGNQSCPISTWLIARGWVRYKMGPKSFWTQSQNNPWRKVAWDRMDPALPDFQPFGRPCSYQKLPLLLHWFLSLQRKPKVVTLFVHKFASDFMG